MRLSVKLAGFFALLVLVEFASYMATSAQPTLRVLFAPVFFAIIGIAAFVTVKRVPLLWGAVVAGCMGGVMALLTYPIGNLAMRGSFAWPGEDPLVVATGFTVTATFATLVGIGAGFLARNRRRSRSRRTAMGRLVYAAYDEPVSDTDEREPVATPMAARHVR
jgi:hypothetical protein